MNRIVTTLSIAAAFAAGCGVTHLLRPALAAETITAQIIHTGDFSGDALGPANAGGMHSKMFMSADGATISIQDGNVGKHMHPNTNEIQYILEGTGTIWLGDKEVRGQAGRPRHHPEGHPAWRHQAGRPAAQGDRDQDPAAGARRHQDAELTRASSRDHCAMARSEAIQSLGRKLDCFVASLTDGRESLPTPLRHARPPHQQAAAPPASRAKSIRMTKADSTNMPANTPATSNTPSACWIR